MTAFDEFRKQFPDEEACLERLMQVRFGGTETACPNCGQHTRFYRMKRELAYVCARCKYQLHPMAGTFMHRSHTPLYKWFFAMFLFSRSGRGVAAKELQRQLGVSYPTALRMARLIRKHMAGTDGRHPLVGDVEAGETYVGGRRRVTAAGTG